MNESRLTQNMSPFPQPIALRPHDVCVALQLVISPEIPYRELAQRVSLSLGEAHNSAKRLEIAHLLMPHRRAPNKRALLEFLTCGVPYAFPGELGPETQGVPTAYSGPLFRDRFEMAEMVVWPSSQGEARGSALAPLCPGAPDFALNNAHLYAWLSVVDVLRIGRSRERNDAVELLRGELLGHQPT